MVRERSSSSRQPCQRDKQGMAVQLIQEARSSQCEQASQDVWADTEKKKEVRLMRRDVS